MYFGNVFGEIFDSQQFKCDVFTKNERSNKTKNLKEKKKKHLGHFARALIICMSFPLYFRAFFDGFLQGPVL